MYNTVQPAQFAGGGGGGSRMTGLANLINARNTPLNNILEGRSQYLHDVTNFSGMERGNQFADAWKHRGTQDLMRRLGMQRYKSNVSADLNRDVAAMKQAGGLAGDIWGTMGDLYGADRDYQGTQLGQGLGLLSSLAQQRSQRDIARTQAGADRYGSSLGYLGGLGQAGIGAQSALQQALAQVGGTRQGNLLQHQGNLAGLRNQRDIAGLEADVGRRGQTLQHILGRMGLGSQERQAATGAAADIFGSRAGLAGQRYKSDTDQLLGRLQHRLGLAGLGSQERRERTRGFAQTTPARLKHERFKTVSPLLLGMISKSMG